MTKNTICDTLSQWVRQRPGLEFGNYGDLSAYRAELRTITRDLHDARRLIDVVRYDTTVTPEILRESFRHAYSGRLTLQVDGTLDYCTGQYWPTEYRRAVCAVLASALWSAARDAMPPAEGRLTRTHGPFTTEHDAIRYRGKLGTPGDYLRALMRDRFGRGIASRWFR